MTRPDKQWALVSKVFQLRLYLELNPFGALTCEIRLPQKEFLKFRVVLGEIPIYQAKEPLAVQGKELRPSPRYPKAYSAHDQAPVDPHPGDGLRRCREVDLPGTIVPCQTSSKCLQPIEK